MRKIFIVSTLVILFSAMLCAADETPGETPVNKEEGTAYVSSNYIEPLEGESLTVYFRVPSEGKTHIKIFTLSGDEICSETRYYRGPAEDYFNWYAKNENGKFVGRGIYFVLVRQGSWQVMKKFVVLK